MNRGIALFIGLAIGSSLGLALGMFLFSHDTPVRATGLDDPIGVDSEQRIEGPAARTEPRRRDAPTSNAAPPVMSSSVEELISSAGHTDSTSGTGTIQGAVTDDMGDPLAGVTVRVQRETKHSPQRSKRGRDAEEWKSLEDEVRELVDSYQERASNRRTTTTDGEGRYSFDDLADGTYGLAAYREGFQISARSGAGRGVELGATVNFKGERVYDVPITVSCASGRAPEKVAIRFSSGDHARRTETDLWTIDEPVLRLVAGSYNVIAEVDDQLAKELALPAELSSQEQDLILTPEAPTAKLHFEMTPRVGIRGQVEVPDNAEAGNILIRLMELAEGANFDPDSFGRSGKTDWAYSYNSFKFEFLDILPGRYALGAFASHNGPILGHRVIEVSDRMMEVTLTYTALNADQFMIVKVASPNGTPLSGANIQARVERDGSTNTFGLTQTTVGPGEYRAILSSDMQKALSEDGAQVFVTASHKLYGSVQQQIQRGQREATLRFREPGTMKVTIAGYVGSGFEGRLSASLAREEDSKSDGNFYFGQSSSNGSVRADGTTTLGPTEIGTYRLKVSARSKNNDFYRNNVIVDQPVSLVQGENQITVGLPALYRLTVRVPGAGSNSHLMLQGEAGGNGWTQVKDGVAEFDDLTAGQYTIRSWGGSANGTMRVNVPAQSDVTFEPEPINALRVSVADGGWLANNGFEDGDLIVAINGAEFSGQEAMAKALSSALGGNTASISVQRGSSTHKLSVNTAEFIANTQAAGSMSPIVR